ncbi:MAG: hypothetical protein ACO3NL_09325 [Phycisphaerales bacterium]
MRTASNVARNLARSAATALAAVALSGLVACEREDQTVAGGSMEDAMSSAIDFSTSLDGNTISTRIDRQRVLVGDPIRLIVVATPAADRVAELAMPESPLGSFDAVALPPPRDATLVPGAKAIALELSTFESGDLRIPSIVARFEPRGGGVEIELASDPIEMVVESVLSEDALAAVGNDAAEPEAGVDPQSLRAIKGVVPMDDGRSEAWWLIASVGATVAVLAAGVLFLRRRSSPAELAPGPWAIGRFAALAESCRRNEPTTPAWDEAAAVLRGYLARGCGIPAADLTTREIVEAIGADPRFADPVRVTIAAFLRQADLVKFAGASTDGEASARILDSMRELVVSLEHAPSDPRGGGDAR